MRQPGPDSGRGLEVKGLKTFPVVPSSLGSGPTREEDAPSSVSLRFRVCLVFQV
jgi:hypothetical protein